ncbi:hypothetical protein CW751_02270 [Brumimicrobium salinarum]|uniref:Fructosamine kinase n=1 Tax=Brumimicrobium salinarum TaxID=2058658 RepID=A0A2I0R6J5_9FLAO|nr:fructosamine kinase family protein [Brumimicrobium salinarum]PKR82179.1 hypothetical protein CW751_02270 [Brumimicrobium salinarum]
MNINWDQIQQGGNFDERPEFLRQLHGGDINDVYLIKADQALWVVKQNVKHQYPKMLEKEFHAMEFLNKKSPLTTPLMHSHFSDEKYQYLLMEYIEEGRTTHDAQERLGIQLAQQHKISNSCYGWTEDNYIGSLKQINTQKSTWSDFYAEERILYLSKKAFDLKLLIQSDIKKLENFCSKLNEIIPVEKPALLHGDLWGGNYFISIKNDPVIYDPAIYFGHREMDIAMTKLFGGFSSAFYEGYQATFPLSHNWKDRMAFLQLYPNLVHLILFGTGYKPAIDSVIKQF